MKYNYKSLTVQSYLDSLYQDGFKTSTTLSDEMLEKNISDIGIFKFKGYVKAFRDDVSKYSIDDIVKLYKADRDISAEFFKLSSKIEIKLKSHLIDIVYRYISNPFFYLLKSSYIEDFKIGDESIYDWEVQNRNSKQKSEIYLHYRDYYLANYDFESNKKEYLAK
ncbi:MAG: Abi family protein, partial [Campylobacterales bacterium]|nr:Abi family protein [Campylobacterales bacterium]